MRVVFTDLDGSLLTAEGQVSGAARPALRALQRRDIPVIVVSRRTRSELEPLRQQLQLEHPFISEDGAAVWVPEDYFPQSVLGDGWQPKPPYYCHPLGLPYDHLRQVLQDIRQELATDLVGFGDWTDEELAATLGLAPAEAALIHQREYSEIFSYGGDRQPLTTAVENHHLQLHQLTSPVLKGRWYLTGNVDKGEAVKLLLSCYTRQVGPLQSLGLGDAPTDAPVLAHMDESVVLPGVHSEALWAGRSPSWRQASLHGPEGWNDMVLDWLERTDSLED